MYNADQMITFNIYLHLIQFTFTISLATGKLLSWIIMYDQII